jgi:hypothetical protein
VYLANENKGLFVRKHIKLFAVDKQPGLIKRRNFVFYPRKSLNWTIFEEKARSIKSKNLIRADPFNPGSGEERRAPPAERKSKSAATYISVINCSNDNICL